MNIEPIAHVESPFPVKFGVPRQPGLVRGLVSWLVFDGEDGDGGLGGGGGEESPSPFSQLAPVSRRPAPDEKNGTAIEGPQSGSDGGLVWLVWGFSKNDGHRVSPTIRPPRLGGNARVGVFASRSSFRPNGLAISAVRVVPASGLPEAVAGSEAGAGAGDSSDGGSRGGCPRRIALVGADLVDGTPVYGLRPYAPARDSIPEATSGWIEEHSWPALSDVVIPEELLARVPRELRRGVREVLIQDPRPAYTRKTQPGRVFWVPIARLIVRFRVEDGVAVVVDVAELTGEEYARLRETGTVEL